MGREILNNRRKTILHVIDALNYGGAQQLLVQLARWTPADTYRTLVCVFQPQLDVRDQIEACGVPVYAFNRARPSVLRPHRLIRYFCRNVKDILDICRREAVDVLHCHLSDAELFGIPAGRLSGRVRIVSTVHYPDLLPQRPGVDPRNLLRKLATRIIYHWADQVIAVSEDVAVQLRRTFGLPRAKLKVVVNGIDTGRFAPGNYTDPFDSTSMPDRSGGVVLSVGRLMPPKGHAYLIDAAAALKERFPGLRFLLAGDGDLKPALMERCRRKTVTGHVRFLGSRRDIDRLLARADIFVMPSLAEGTSLALLEAMAAGRPIVCTDIPGNRGLMVHLHNCYKVPPADAAGLAEGIAFFLSRPQTARRCAENARALVKEKYDIRQTVSALARIWG